MAGDLDADHERLAERCTRCEASGHLERTDDGRAYRLTEVGDQVRAFLDEREGKRAFLRWLEDARTLASRISRGGPDYPRMSATDLGMDLAHVRHCYRAVISSPP